MTPEELRSLADEATPGPWQRDSNAPITDEWDICAVSDDGALRTGVARMLRSRVHYKLEADARLIALAPDLARLCAELGEALTETLAAVAWTSVYPKGSYGFPEIVESIAKAEAVLAKFTELNNGAEHPPGAERT